MPQQMVILLWYVYQIVVHGESLSNIKIIVFLQAVFDLSKFMVGSDQESVTSKDQGEFGEGEEKITKVLREGGEKMARGGKEGGEKISEDGEKTDGLEMDEGRPVSGCPPEKPPRIYDTAEDEVKIQYPNTP